MPASQSEIKKLKKKYNNITLASTDPEVHDYAYKDLLTKLYKLGDNKRIFRHLQVVPMQNAIEAMYSYLLDGVSLPDFYSLVMDTCILMYVNNLLEFDVINSEAAEGQEDLYELVVLEAVKAMVGLDKLTRRLYCGLEDMTFAEKRQLRTQDRTAYIAWFNIIEKLHAQFNLPAVKDFINCMWSAIEPVGHVVLAVNDFTEFNLLPGELEEYRELCR